jgi:hypothetical protein
MPAMPKPKAAADDEQHRGDDRRGDDAAQIEEFVGLDHADGEADQRHENDDNIGELAPRGDEIVAQVAVRHQQDVRHQADDDGDMGQFRCLLERRKRNADEVEDGDYATSGRPSRPEFEFVVEQRHDEQPEEGRRQHGEQLERNDASRRGRHGRDSTETIA